MKITDMTPITSLTGAESIEIVQDGVSKRCTLDQIAAAQPDSNGVYPDVPLNRVTLKRYSGQTSTTVVVSDNLGMIDAIAATAYPVLLDRNSEIVAYLNGNDITKTADGLTATLNDWLHQCMVRMGGIYYKYYYVASTNEKVFHFSTKKVRGYKYIRRRFLNMFGGTVEEHDSKLMLLSIADRYTTQSKTISQYHTYAKNLGEHYREIATQDREVYRYYFWLLEQTFNSQSVLRGICDVSWSDWYSNDDEYETEGAHNCPPFHLTGITKTIAGHKGEISIQHTFVGNGNTATVKPYKWLWRENMLSGPYWIWETGYMKKGGKWYRAKNINTNVSFDPTDTANWEFVCDECTVAGYILENYADTLLPSLTGGSDSTGHADNYWRADDANALYIPAGVGSALDGSNLGVSVLSSNPVVSSAHPNFGGALASDDPTDTIADGTIVA